MTAPALVLVEPGAHRAGGHRHRTLTALAASHGNTVVVAPREVAAETREALRAAGARITRPRGALPTLLVALGLATAATAEAAVRAVALSGSSPQSVRRFPHQVMLVSRCLIEAACIRTGRRLAGPSSAVVVLSASEALHGAAALLAGPHTRFVHEVVTTEDTALRLVGRLARRGERRVQMLAPTEAVRDDLATRFPRLPVRVRPFAIADEDDRLARPEREQARKALGIPSAAAVVCLVGGWWPYKDFAVVETALAQLDVPVHVVVAGAPLHTSVLDRWFLLPRVRLHVVPGPVSEPDIRAVYAASDAALVTRRPGTGKESGLVVDALRLGVPLIVSDHDAALAAALAGRDWARVFRSGDGAALARALNGLARSPLPRPPRRGGAEFGVPTSVEQVRFLTLPEELR